MERITNIDDSYVLLETLKRPSSNKIRGYGIWLIQGTEQNPTEYYIPDDELEEYIQSLKLVQNRIHEINAAS